MFLAQLKMKGFMYDPQVSSSPILVTNLPRPVAQTNHALIRVLRAGICRTDLEICDGYKDGYSGVLGHEFVGLVEDVNASNTIKQTWLNQRVIGEINIACMKCETCINSRRIDFKRNHCPNRSCLGILRKDGCFAEYITLPVENLYVVPHHIPDASAVFAEPLAAAYRIIEQNIIQRNDNVCIIGDGKLGLLVADVLVHALKEENVSVTMIGKHFEKLDLGT